MGISQEAPRRADIIGTTSLTRPSSMPDVSADQLICYDHMYNSVSAWLRTIVACEEDVFNKLAKPHVGSGKTFTITGGAERCLARRLRGMQCACDARSPRLSARLRHAR
eukprot:3637537-Amphidinium_carterae.2